MAKETLVGNPEIVAAMERLADFAAKQSTNSQLAQDIALLIYQMPFTEERLVDMKKGKLIPIADLSDAECRHALTCLVRDARMANDMMNHIMSQMNDFGQRGQEAEEHVGPGLHTTTNRTLH